MASATRKRTCAKCNKGGGTAMCHGCEQSFCTKHFIEHRQELSQQIDNIGQEHDVLQRDLAYEQGIHPLLAHIDQWEQESIIKIQTVAKSARTDLQQLLNKTKNNLKISVSKMKEELQSSRESDDFTEMDINKWTKQLQEFRKMLDNPTTVNIYYENDIQSAIRLIKVNNQRSSSSFYQESQLQELNNQFSQNLEISPTEKFDDIFGKVILSEGGLMATRSDNFSDRCCVSGIGRYSSGVHHIRFRIKKKSSHYYSFFGIVNSSKQLTEDIWQSTSCHGWWDLDYYVISGNETGNGSESIIRTGDELTLLLDCNKQRIQLEHHRTNRITHMPIDLQRCAFPWKIIVLLLGKDDCVEILD